MSEFAVTVVDAASGRTETLPLAPSTTIAEVIGFAQALFGISGEIHISNNGKRLEPSSSLSNAGVVNGDMLAVQRRTSRPTSSAATAPATATTGGGGLDFSNLLNQSSAPVAASTSGGLNFSNLLSQPAAQPTEVYYPGMSLDDAMMHNPHPRAFVSLLKAKDHLFKELRYHNPPLASKIEKVPMEKAVEIWKEEIVKGGIASAVKRTTHFHKNEEMTRRLAANPEDKEAREFFAEIERKKNVEEQYIQMMEQYPEAMGRVLMLYVDAKINGHPIQAFCDSGAQMTIMSKKVAHECGLDGLIDTRFSGMASGVGTSKILGKIHIVQLQIGNSYFPCSVSVMDDPPPGAQEMPFLLGLDMMKRHLCQLDLQTSMLRFPMAGVEAPFLHEKDLSESQGGTRGFDADKANMEVQEALMKQYEKKKEKDGDDDPMES